mgnify:CR=1 FL=1
MENITVICNIEHDITPGVCCFCQRDKIAAQLEAVNERCRVGYDALRQANANFEVERKARKEIEGKTMINYPECEKIDSISLAMLKERAEAAERRCAQIEAETIERCAKTGTTENSSVSTAMAHAGYMVHQHPDIQCAECGAIYAAMEAERVK